MQVKKVRNGLIQQKKKNRIKAEVKKCWTRAS